MEGNSIPWPAEPLTICLTPDAVGKVCLFLLIALCLGFSYPHANTHNWDNFFPFGAHGVFAGASVIYFSYGGYNACTNFAEEVGGWAWQVHQKQFMRVASLLQQGGDATLHLSLCLRTQSAFAIALGEFVLGWQ